MCPTRVGLQILSRSRGAFPILSLPRARAHTLAARAQRDEIPTQTGITVECVRACARVCVFEQGEQPGSFLRSCTLFLSRPSSLSSSAEKRSFLPSFLPSALFTSRPFILIFPAFSAEQECVKPPTHPTGLACCCCLQLLLLLLLLPVVSLQKIHQSLTLQQQ